MYVSSSRYSVAKVGPTGKNLNALRFMKLLILSIVAFQKVRRFFCYQLAKFVEP